MSFLSIKDLPKLRTSVTQFTFVSAATMVQIIGPSEKRRAISFGTANNINVIGVKPNNDPNVNATFLVGSSGSPCRFEYEWFGDAVKKSWFGFSVTAGFIVLICECLEE